MRELIAELRPTLGPGLRLVRGGTAPDLRSTRGRAARARGQLQLVR